MIRMVSFFRLGLDSKAWSAWEEALFFLLLGCDDGSPFVAYHVRLPLFLLEFAF